MGYQMDLLIKQWQEEKVQAENDRKIHKYLQKEKEREYFEWITKRSFSF
jgi:hypothetical protein